MKNKILLLAILFLTFSKNGIINSVSAQTVSTYTFASSFTNYVSLSGSAATILNQAPTNADDQIFSPVSIGFPFIYHGASFTSISLSPNCYAVFGGSTSISYVPLTTDANCIAVMASNMMATSTGHFLRYITTGSSGSQIFTAEWYNWGHSANGLSEMNIQLKLYEATGAVQIVYQPAATSQTSTYPCEVGLTGAAFSDFNNRTTTAGSWNSTIAGTVNSATMSFSGPNQMYPSNGLTWTWLPPSTNCTGTPTAGTVVCSAPNPVCTGVSYTLSLSGASTSTGLTYQWQSSPNGTTWTNIAGATNATYTTASSASGVISYRCIVTCTASGMSATSSILQLYITAPPTVTISPSGTQSICPGQSITLTANGASSYVWSNQATTGSITVSAAGYYTVIGTTGGCSATSAPVLVTVTACATPTGLSTSNIGQHSAVIHWSAVTCAYAYQIYYRASQYTNWQYVNVAAGSTSYTLVNLQNNYYVQWKIRTICTTSSMSAWSATQTFHTLARLGGDEPTATTDALSITAYPNPTNGNVTVQLNIFSDETNVTVTNMLGQIVQQQKYNTGNTNGEIQLNMADLSAGVYMVFVDAAEGKRCVKIIKN